MVRGMNRHLYDQTRVNGSREDENIWLAWGDSNEMDEVDAGVFVGYKESVYNFLGYLGIYGGLLYMNFNKKTCKFFSVYFFGMSSFCGLWTK